MWSAGAPRPRAVSAVVRVVERGDPVAGHDLGARGGPAGTAREGGDSQRAGRRETPDDRSPDAARLVPGTSIRPGTTTPGTGDRFVVRVRVVEEIEVGLDGGGVLHVYDTAPSGSERLAVFWHHGTPNVGAPPAPLFPAAERLGLRWVSYDRPGYGGSTPAGAATWRRRRATSPASPTPGASTGSGSWATPAAGPTPWPAVRCSGIGSSRWSAWRGWPRTAPRASTGSRAWPRRAWRPCEPRPTAGGQGALRGRRRRVRPRVHRPPTRHADGGVGVVRAWSVRPGGGGGRADRRRPRRGHPVGVRPGAGRGPDAAGARGPRPGRARRARGVAGGALPGGRSCGCDRATGTSRSSPPPRTRSSGWRPRPGPQRVRRVRCRRRS